jgi:beta-galactosidase
MPGVSLTDRALAINGREVYLRSGEIHYFRIPRDAWKDRVQAARDGGLNCISSYIPWFWHEPEEGTFDFTGATLPERDALGFIDLVAGAGLHFIARPGPFVNAELACGGHPAWIFSRYPDVASRRADGTAAFWVGEGVPVPSQLHPRFLALTERWYRQVIPLIAERTVPKGGPVILVQPDNEPNLVFTYGIEGSLYDEHVTGAGGLWARWCAERGAAPVLAPAPNAADTRLLLDWLRFKQWHVFEFLRRLMALATELGVDVPFVVNEPLNRYWAWRGGDHAAFSLACADLPVFTAGHCYFTYGGEQDAIGLPMSITRMEAVKASRLPGPPFIIEMGSWFNLADGNRASPNWDAMMRTLVGCGLNAFNVYMYASGRSAPGAARIGRDYDWATAIRTDGRRDRPYEAVRHLSRFLAAWEPEVLATAKHADVSLGLVAELPMLSQAARGRHRQLGEMAATVQDATVDLLRVLTMLNVNVDMISLTYPPPELSAETLIVPCCGFLPRQAGAAIDALLRRGGAVIFYPMLPRDDAGLDALAPLDVGMRVRRVLTAGGGQPMDFRWRPVDGLEAREVGIEGPLVTYEVDQNAEVLATFRGEPCAAGTRVGGGRVIACGLVPRYFAEESQRLFEEIFVRAAGVARGVRSSEPAVVIQRVAPRHQLVAVADVLGHGRGMRLTLSGAGNQRTIPAAVPLVLAPSESRLLWVDLELGYASLRHCTSEIVPEDSGRKRFLAYGAPGTPGEIALDRQLRVRIAGTTAEARRVGDLWVFTYEHGVSPVALEID